MLAPKICDYTIKKHNKSIHNNMLRYDEQTKTI